VIFSLLVVISWFIALYRKTPVILAKAFQSFLFVLSGALGLIFTYMWLFSSFTVCHGNLNLAWAFPLNILLAITLWFPFARRANRLYCRVMSGVSILFLLTFAFWKQSIPFEGILFCLSLLPGLLSQSGLKIFRNAVSEDQAN
jgi:hypothetical protein